MRQANGRRSVPGASGRDEHMGGITSQHSTLRARLRASICMARDAALAALTEAENENALNVATTTQADLIDHANLVVFIHNMRTALDVFGMPATLLSPRKQVER